MPLTVLAVLVVEALWSWHSGLPSSLALSAIAMMVCAGTVLWAAQASVRQDGPEARGANSDVDAEADGAGGPLLQPVLAALLMAGVLSSVIALLQVFAPSGRTASGSPDPACRAGRWAICGNPTTSAR